MTIPIPPEARDAAVDTLIATGGDMVAAIRACFLAWPGMLHIIEGEPGRESAEIILPLPEGPKP